MNNFLFKRVSMFFVMITASALFTLNEPEASTGVSGRVLLLSSYSSDYRWSEDTLKGIRDVFKEFPGIRLSAEYMDARPAAGGRYYKLLFDIYNIKFINTDFDLILCADNAALDFLKQYRNKLFPSVPVVFCGINNFIPSDIKGISGITGVNEKADIEGNIRLIKKLQPHIKKIIAVTEDSENGVKLADAIKARTGKYAGDIEFNIFAGDLAGVFRAVSFAENDTAVLFTLFSRDTTGRAYEYNEIIMKLRNISHVPIYGLWDFQLGSGLTGGILASGYYQGKTAAELALRILRGESPDDIPVIMESPNRYMFDYNELARLKLTDLPLPEGSIVINKKPGIYQFFESYKAEFLMIVISFLAVVLTFFIIIIYRDKRNRKKIIKAEKTLRSILNSMTEAVYLLRTDGLLVEANEEGLRRLSISQRSNNEINIFDYMPEDIANSRKEFIKYAAETGTGVTFTDIRGGLTLLNNINPIENESGIIEQISIASYDITEIKRNEELLKNIILTSPAGIILVNRELDIMMANPAAENLTGIAEDPLKGLYGRLHEVNISISGPGGSINKIITELFETGEQILNKECLVTLPDGGRRFILLNAVPLKDMVKSITGVMVVLLDITERKEMQIELNESRRRLSDILESINDGFFAINRDGIIIYVNAQAEEVWGLKSEKIVGEKVEDVFKRRYFEKVYEHFEMALNQNLYTQIEHYQKHLKKWFMLHFYPYADGISIYFTDITYRKDLEEKLKEMAHTDALTGVLNRRAGLYILEKSILSSVRDRRPLSICFMDVDGLKSVNDTYGHNEGDRLLTDISGILNNVFRGSDTLCRLGGDEFMAILPGCGSDQTPIIKKRIQARLDKANSEGARRYKLDVSIGFAYYPSDRELSAEEFIEIADCEMYNEKQAKKTSR